MFKYLSSAFPVHDFKELTNLLCEMFARGKPRPWVNSQQEAIMPRPRVVMAKLASN